ncbi:MAG: hypothetical protein FWC27_04910, partial [Firmicutes bacterium]|nr:hypothetical protein [Bacillota bacterium]
ALLVLAACGRAEPETIPETTTEIETTTETETTTKEPTTIEIPTLPASGESNGVKWRTLDLSDRANAALKEELQRRENEEGKTEFQIGNKKIVTSYEQIEMVDETGRRTVLLEIDKIDVNNEMSWKYPRVIATLDDRYFLYAWMGYYDGLNMGVYDTKDMKEITIIDYVLNTVKTQGDYLYFIDTESEETYHGQPHLYRYDWTAIKRGEPVTGVDLLAGFNGEDAAFGHDLLTDDLRYYLALEGVAVSNWRNWGYQIRIYDLANKKLLSPLPEPDFHVDILREWNGKIYWVAYSDPDYALEITLP